MTDPVSCDGKVGIISTTTIRTSTLQLAHAIHVTRLAVVAG